MSQKEAIMRALMEAMSKSGAPSSSKRPPSMKKIGMRGNPGIGGDAYSPEDFERLMGSQDAKMPKKYNKGGAVKKKRSPNKPSKGCVMSGRGGKYKGMK